MSEQGTTRPGHLRLLTEKADREPPELVAVEQRTPSRPAHARTSIRVLIAAGQALLRASYGALLERDERIEVVGEAASGEQALALAVETLPDIAVLDLALPDLDDLQAITAIVSHQAFARLAVMLITPSEDDERVLTALRAGAVGVLSEDAEPAELIRALQVLADGQALLPARAVRRLLAELPPQSPHRSALPDQVNELTDREREVVTLVGLGLSNSEIAAQLVISPATAKTHVSRAMVKLHARDRAKLVVLAYETGLVLRRTNVPGSSELSR